MKKNTSNFNRPGFLNRFSKEKGFTLIELLVVIFIIGVLVSLLLANILGARQRAEDVEKKSNLNQIKKALRLFYNDNQSYPDVSGNNFTDAVIDGTAVVTPAAFTDGNTIYMKSVPEYGRYDVDANGEQFVLIVELDNASDSDIAESRAKCDSSLIATGQKTAVTSTETEYVVCED